MVLVGRPGMHGSSGDHARDRHTRAEVDLLDAKLTALRRRYGFRGFVLSGFSSGARSRPTSWRGAATSDAR